MNLVSVSTQVVSVNLCNRATNANSHSWLSIQDIKVEAVGHDRFSL